MSAWLYRLRGEWIGAWCVLVGVLSWPARGTWVSGVPLVAGLALRVWARRYAGAHTRGREMAAPYRAVGGPYRFASHPLYLANLLVLAGLAWRLQGNHLPAIALSLSGPLLLYAILARSESRLLATTNAPVREQALDALSGRWRSEWASLAPPLLVWFLLGW